MLIDAYYYLHAVIIRVNYVIDVCFSVKACSDCFMQS